MHKTDYLETKILEHLFKDAAYTAPSNLYVALYVVPTWQASTSYSAGQYVIPTTFNSSGPRRLYRCTTAGTSGSSEPTWPTTDGGTVTDGSVTWTEATPTIESGTNLPNEVSGGGYSRKAIAAGTGWGSITDETSGGGKYVANAADVDFGTATADWGQIPLAILWDAASAGNPLYYVVLDQAKTVQNGDPVKIVAGALKVAER
jgi:hypothetical protein